jgi:hypothetical protein
MGRLATARPIGLRQCERGNTENGALDRPGNGARIDHVFAGVAAAVDAGKHQVGRAILDHVARAHDDAVGRRALDRKAALADLAQPQRIVERERVRDAGLVELRRDHPDVVGQRTADLDADVEPLRMDAVIVGDEDTHGFGRRSPHDGGRTVLRARFHRFLSFVLRHCGRHPARSIVFKPPIELCSTSGTAIEPPCC